jgi:hypothetical protein
MSLDAVQSSGKAFRCLKAQRQLYSEAKGWWIADFVLTVAVTVFISVIRVFVPDVDLSLLAGCWALIATFLSFVLFAPTFKKKQAEAAAIQELFDCEVLEIDENPMISQIPEDQIVELADHFDREGKCDEALNHWYPAPLARLPTVVATAVCQRINSRWDKKLRARYLQMLWYTTGAFVLVVMVTSLSLNLTLKGFIMSAIIPLLPGLKFLIKQVQDSYATTQRLEKLSEHSQARLDKMISGDEPRMTARNIQDEIYSHRKSAGLIPDWFFMRHRSADETSMKSYATQFVVEYERTQPS